jgi:hypothetical protein
MALREPHLGAAVDRFRVEGAVGAEVAAARPVGRVPQVHGCVGVGRLLALLGLVPGPGQVSVEQAGGELVA